MKNVVPMRGARAARAAGPALALLLAALTAAGAPHAVRAEDAAPKPVTLSVERFDDRLYRISGSEAGGVMVLVGRKGLLLVDSEDAANAAVFDSVLRTISKLPVRYVVNTHYHYDHIGGNGRYAKKGAKIVAHENMWAQARKDTVVADWGDWHRKAAPEDARPGTTFRDSLRLTLDGDPVVLMHVPAAHTDGDVLVWFPKHDVLHTGDVVEIGAAPFVDLWAGGTVGGMISAIHRFMRMAGPATRIVPGHGRPITLAELREYRAMVAGLATRASEAIREERGLDSFVEIEAAQPYEEQLGGKRAARRFCALLYYGLNGMKR